MGVARALAVIEADDADAADCRDGNGFELGAAGPAAHESPAMQVDQHAVAIAAGQGIFVFELP